MSNNTNSPSSDTPKKSGMKRAGLATISSSLVLGVISLTGISAASAAEAPISLGTVGSYSVLGGQAVTNTGSSVLGQDLGVSPGTAITGFPPGLVLGSTHAGDAVALQAQSDLVVAYDDAAGRAPTQSIAGDLVGQTLPGGVYKSTGPLAVSGTLTLDGQGDPSSVFVFQVASTLITASASSINLINGAQACNVYWQVGSSATLGTASVFKGTIMALTSVSVTTDATVEGRALARNGEVTLDNNVFTSPGCLTAVPTPSATATATATVPPIATTPPVATTPPSTTSAPTATPTRSATTPKPVTSTTPGMNETSSAPVTTAPGETDISTTETDNAGTTETEDAGTMEKTGDFGGGDQLADTGVDSKHWIMGGVGLALLIIGLLMTFQKRLFIRRH